MSTNIPLDPISMWKKIYEQTEANWSNVLQELMEKEAFSEGMGDTLNQYLQYQELVNKMTETYLKEINIPSRQEIADIGSLIINLEEKFDQLNDEIDERFQQLNKLEKSLTKIDEKISTIYQSSKSINK